MDEILKQLNVDEIIAVQTKLKDRKLSYETSLAEVNQDLELADSLIAILNGKSA
jgi:hypothetical protein